MGEKRHIKEKKKPKQNKPKPVKSNDAPIKVPTTNAGKRPQDGE